MVLGRAVSFGVSLLTSQPLQSCDCGSFLEEQGDTTLPVQQQMFRALRSGERSRRQLSAHRASWSSAGENTRRLGAK